MPYEIKDSSLQLSSSDKRLGICFHFVCLVFVFSRSVSNSGNIPWCVSWSGSVSGPTECEKWAWDGMALPSWKWKGVSIRWRDKEATTGHNYLPSAHLASDFIPLDASELSDPSLLHFLLSVPGSWKLLEKTQSHRLPSLRFRGPSKLPELLPSGPPQHVLAFTKLLL